MITLKINLLELKGSIMNIKRKQGGEMECLVLPLELNDFFRGEKGLYLDMVAFEIKNKKEGQRDTHLIKQSFSKEVRDTMTDDEIKAIPILGNLCTTFTGKDPVSSAETVSEDDGLPF